MKRTRISLALAVATSALIVLPTTSASAAPMTGARIAGADRYETAVKISQSAFTSADVVFLASGENFPDALSAGPAASHAGAPVLLTPKNSLDSKVAAEIQRLNPKIVVIVGGENSVSPAVAAELARIVPNSSYKSIVNLDALLNLQLGKATPAAAQPAGLVDGLVGGLTGGNTGTGTGNTGGLIGGDGLVGGLIGGGGGTGGTGNTGGTGGTNTDGLLGGLLGTGGLLGDLLGGSGSGVLDSAGNLIDIGGNINIDILEDIKTNIDLGVGVNLGNLDLANGDLGGLLNIDLGVGAEVGDLDLGVGVGVGTTDGIGVGVGLDLGLDDLGVGTERGVIRVGGADRFETAKLVAELAWGDYTGPAYVARGDIFPDALSGGAAAASVGAPLLLSATNEVPAATGRYLSDRNVTGSVLFGSNAALSANVESQVRTQIGTGTVVRIGGVDRFETAAKAALRHHSDADRIFIATGTNYPDALAGIPAAAVNGSPILLTNQDCTPIHLSSYVSATTPESFVVLGGENTVKTEGLSKRC